MLCASCRCTSNQREMKTPSKAFSHQPHEAWTTTLAARRRRASATQAPLWQASLMISSRPPIKSSEPSDLLYTLYGESKILPKHTSKFMQLNYQALTDLCRSPQPAAKAPGPPVWVRTHFFTQRCAQSDILILQDPVAYVTFKSKS